MTALELAVRSREVPRIQAALEALTPPMAAENRAALRHAVESAPALGDRHEVILFGLAGDSGLNLGPRLERLARHEPASAVELARAEAYPLSKMEQWAVFVWLDEYGLEDLSHRGRGALVPGEIDDRVARIRRRLTPLVALMADLLESSARDVEARLLRALVAELEASFHAFVVIEALQATEGPVELDPEAWQLFAERLADPDELDNPVRATYLGLLSRELSRLRGDGEARERVIGLVLGASQAAGDTASVSAALSLVPETPSLPFLAFNAACAHARRGELEACVRMTRCARALGTSREDFDADHDFDAVRATSAFEAALADDR